MRRLTCLFHFAISFFCGVCAQEPIYTHFKLFKVEDGLPQSFISGLVQDQDGFLWIGTRDGLARYDGREFRVFRHNNNDSTSLRSSVIIDLYLDPQNLLWVTYVNQKLDCFDPRQLRLSEEKPLPELQQLLSEYKVGKFFRDHAGKFWLNTNYRGIISIDGVTKKVTQFNTDNKNLASNNNLGSVEDPRGRICVFTERGLQISDEKGTKMEKFFPFDSQLNFKFTEGAYNKVACLPEGKLVLTENNRLIIFDLKKETFSSIRLPGIPKQPDVIKYLVTAPDGLLYIEAAGSVYRLEKNLSVTYIWRSSNTNPFANDARSFVVDRSGVAWFGTNAAGLYKIDLHSIPFTNIFYKKNFVTDNLAALPGLTFDKMPESFRKGSWAYAFRYCYDSRNNLFISYAETQNAPGAGIVYVYKNNSLIPLPDNSPGELPVKGLSISSDGKLYAVDRLGNFRIWKNINALPDTFPTVLSLNMQTGDVSDVEVSDNTILIAVEKDGLYKIENNRVVEHYVFRINDKKSLPTNQLTDLCRDPVDKNSIWVGTLGQGLMKWNVRTGMEKIYTIADGLPNSTIYSIVADRTNKLWISTNKGVCRFDPQAETFYNFDVGNGLISNEFNRFHHFILPGGNISFGSFEGYSVFDPSLFEPDNFQTPIAFTKLFINNIETQLSTSGINELSELKLPYNQNFLSFEFAGLQLNQPEKIRYRYMLKGYDRDWIQTGSRNVATYTRLPAGRYTLLVNASNTSGSWSPAIKQLSIRIKPPFWATWWAYAFYVTMVCVLISTYWKYRVNRIRMQNEIVLEQNKATHLQEVDEIKDRFFDNITHELRTPLTLILTPVEKLSKDVSLSAAHRHVLSNAYHNAEQLLRLINQLLDISKIESGQMKVNLSAGELDKFIENCVDSFSLQAKEKNINLFFNSQDVSGHYKFDEEKLQKIVFNLLSNAIKFTPGGGKVSVALRSLKKERSPGIELRVADSGIGISEERAAKIFDRFYMADDSGTRSHSGTGIGLSLVKELTQLLKGHVEVNSEPGKGTVFVVELPFERIETTGIEHKPAVENIFSPGPDQVELSSPEIHEGPLLLVVEDNDELRSFISESLAVHWRVVEAANGRAAWEIILKELPEIVISDVMMPQMDGMELCRISKNDERTQHISFVLLTAKAAHQSKLTGLGVGADEYITKPFHFDELELRIRNLLQQQARWRKHLRQELLPEKPLPKLPHVNDLFVQKLYHYLDERLDEPDMDVENLAAGMSMSRRTLNRKLRLILNVSANDLIRKYRLQKAASLIASGHSITQTAYTVGFETPSYFTQCFKEQYGQTPTEFAAQKTA